MTLKILHYYKDNQSGRIDLLRKSSNQSYRHRLRRIDKSFSIKNFVDQSDYDLMCVHHDLDFLERLLMRDIRGKIAFLPHSNLVSNGSRRRWKRIMRRLNRDLILIVGSKRVSSGFPDLSGQDFLRPWVCPTFGIDGNPIAKWKNEKRFDIGFFGRMDPDKAPHFVFEIAEKLSKLLERNINVVFCGKENLFCGPYFSYFISNVKLPENVHYTWVDNPTDSEFQAYLSSCRCVVHPGCSLWETWCRVAWESVSLGVPFVGPDWDGIGEASELANNGIFSVPVIEDLECCLDHSEDAGFQSFESLLHFNNFVSDMNKMSCTIAEIIEIENHPKEFCVECGRYGRFLETLSAICAGDSNHLLKETMFFKDQRYLANL